MPPPFLRLTKDEFTTAVDDFAWPTPKTEIHVHHTWRPNHSQYRGLRTIQSMYDYHTGTNGWSDIAQHVSIGPDGSIWTGRAWGRSPASASGHNGAHVFMFETIGDFDTGHDPLADDQLDSVLHVVATLQSRFDLSTDDSIRFHNQMSAKSCPGTSIDRSAFIAQVAERRAAMEAVSRPTITSDRKTEILSALSSSGAEALGDDGDAELEHGSALELFMEDRATNPFLSGGAGLESTLAENEVASAAADLADKVTGDEEIEALFVELGRRAQIIAADPAQAGLVTPEAAPVDESFLSGFAEIGKRIFSRVEKQLHGLMCGHEGEDAADRARLREAFGVGGGAVAGALVTVLTGTLGLAPGIAAVIAAILIRVVLKPAYEETCTYWSEKLAV